jgi:hypothetical protein
MPIRKTIKQAIPMLMADPRDMYNSSKNVIPVVTLSRIITNIPRNPATVRRLPTENLNMPTIFSLSSSANSIMGEYCPVNNNRWRASSTVRGWRSISRLIGLICQWLGYNLGLRLVGYLIIPLS